MAKQVVFNEEARRALKRGVDIVADAVKTTLGPRGRNVAIDKKFGSPTVTHDGVTVAKEIELKDPFENMGARLLVEAATKTDDVAGDGTTTATVLAQAIVTEGLQLVAAGANPMLIKRGLDKGADGAGRGAQGAWPSRCATRREIAQCRGDLGRRQRDRQPARRGDGQGRQGRRDHGRGKQGHSASRRSTPRACRSTAAISRPTSSPTPSAWKPSWKIPTS